jgi:uncharacterized membrane protein YphA (DoxX/SURF4 family)
MQSRELGFLGLASLLLLRLSIGWHFFQEGMEKFLNDGFSATPFLQEATGPWAKSYHNMIVDRLGEIRLDPEKRIAHWRDYGKVVSTAAGFDESKRKEVDEVLAKHEKWLNDYMKSRAPDLEELRADIERLKSYKTNPTSNLPGFEQGWQKKRWKEFQGDLAGWLKELKAMDDSLEHSLKDLVPADAAKIPQLQRLATGKTWVENRVTWTNVLVGGMLLVGFCVPVASLVGAGFLLSVMATQPFWVPDAILTYAYYQAVEIAALLVLATTSAGRIAGLDYFLASFLGRMKDGSRSDAYTS